MPQKFSDDTLVNLQEEYDKTQIQEVEVSFVPNVSIKPNKNIEKPPTEIFVEAEGNEKRALVAPSMAKICSGAVPHR